MISYNTLLNFAGLVGAVFIILFITLAGTASDQVTLYVASKPAMFEKAIGSILVPLLVVLLVDQMRFRILVGLALLIGILVSIGLQHFRLMADNLQPRFIYRISALFLLGSVSFSAFVGAMIIRR